VYKQYKIQNTTTCCHKKKKNSFCYFNYNTLIGWI